MRPYLQFRQLVLSIPHLYQSIIHPPDIESKTEHNPKQKPIFLLGIITTWEPLMYVGIILFALVVLFSLITLPVEYDASRRATAMLVNNGYLTQDEEKGVRSVLNAAALTYVASFVSALMQLLRLISIARRRD